MDGMLGVSYGSGITVPNGLVAYLPLDACTTSGSSTFDVVGTNTGILTGSPPAVIGQVEKALSFDGSTQFVTFGNDASLNPAAITICAWVNFTALTPAYNAIVVKSQSIPSVGYWQLFVKSTGKLALYMFATASVSYDGTGSNTLVTGTWYHLVASYSSAAGLVGYVNGAVDGTAAANGTLATNNVNNASIAEDLGTAGRRVNGLIDDVRIYNRALSAAEVTLIYNAGLAGHR